jgi:hypothetical protein
MDSTIFYLVIWALCAVCGYKVMDGKGREPIIGALLGGLLGLIGIIICYCHSDKSK